ncbi:PolC-type DNA polymerase III N-terminal domain-containing protein, partial [Streptococcus pneumoniae]
MSNSFEILMNQLGMPAEMRQAPALAQANIERVVVHKISKVWEFHFVFSNILPIEIFLELKKGLSEEFSKTGNKAVFEIKARSQEFSNQLLQSYYREAFSEGPCASQGFKSLYQNLQVRAEG